jgi:hypothetical protein
VAQQFSIYGHCQPDARVPTSFKVFIDFQVHEFDGFASVVCFIVRDNERGTNVERVVIWGFMKLTREQ